MQPEGSLWRRAEQEDAEAWGLGHALTQGVPAGQAAVQGLGMDVQGPVELLAVPLTAPLQVAQEVAETYSQRYLGVPELEEEGAQDRSGWRTLGSAPSPSFLNGCDTI